MKKLFNTSYLIDELILPENAVEDEVVGRTRWSIVHEIVFKDLDGSHWKVCYAEGATEYQDERPWEHCETIEAYQVELKEVAVLRWELVDA